MTAPREDDRRVITAHDLALAARLAEEELANAIIEPLRAELDRLREQLSTAESAFDCIVKNRRPVDYDEWARLKDIARIERDRCRAALDAQGGEG